MLKPSGPMAAARIERHRAAIAQSQRGKEDGL